MTSQKTPKDSHYARLRRQHRDSQNTHKSGARARPNVPFGDIANNRIRLYGIHTVTAALNNPNRQIYKILATVNAQEKLGLAPSQFPVPVDTVNAKDITNLVGSEAVHQGIMIETAPLKTRKIDQLSQTNLVVILDQVTDPHNVGAIMRSAVAFNAGAIITTSRHSPQESGVLAKSASGALELIDYICVRNLSETIEQLHALGFQTLGLDSAGENKIEDGFDHDKLALVLGAEGKGLRQKTRQTVQKMVRLDMPGEIKSLNVSNATAISLYAAQNYLSRINSANG